MKVILVLTIRFIIMVVEHLPPLVLELELEQGHFTLQLLLDCFDLLLRSSNFTIFIGHVVTFII